MTGCFQSGSVVRRLSACDRFDAIRELINSAPVFSGVGDKNQLEMAAIRRETISSTGLGRGVAVAHGTTPAVNKIMIALGISEKGINFDSVDKVPVHLLFLITNPPECKVEYLIALAAVTRLIRDETFRNSLYAAVSCSELEKKMCCAFCSCLERYNNNNNGS